MRETESVGRPTAEQIERLFVGSAPRHTRGEVAERAGVPLELAQRIWRALGRPRRRPGSPWTWST